MASKAKLERVITDMDGEKIGNIVIRCEGNSEDGGKMDIELNLDEQVTKLSLPADEDLFMELQDILADATNLLKMDL